MRQVATFENTANTFSQKAWTSNIPCYGFSLHREYLFITGIWPLPLVPQHSQGEGLCALGAEDLGWRTPHPPSCHVPGRRYHLPPRYVEGRNADVLAVGSAAKWPV